MSQQGRPRDSWRKAAGGSAKATRGPAGKSGTGARRWVIAAFVVAALAGAIAGLFVYLQPDPEPVVLVLPITQYKRADWPANPLADADARSFFESFPGRTAPAFPDQEKARILGAIQQVVEESLTKSVGRPILIYLNALAIARSDTAYILPGDADPDDDSTWLPLDEVLALLGKAKVPRVLILDLRPVSSPRSVVATADLNETIQAKLKARTNPEEKLWILTANTPGDGPTLLRAVRQSAFGLAMSQGAGGRADGWNPEKHTNGKVSFQEFAQYTRQATLIATNASGGGDQLPALFGPGGDFPLVSVPLGGPKVLPEKIDTEPYPEWLKASWIERDKWLNEGLHRRAPRIPIQQALVASRAEDAWYAGLDPAAIQDRHAPVLKKLAEAGKAFPPLSLPKKSHARWSAPSDAIAQEALAAVALRSYLSKIQSDEPIKKEDLQMALQLTRGALDAKAAEISPEAIQGAILNTAWNLKSPTQEQLARAAALLATVPTANRLSESILVSWIAGLPPEQVREWEKAEAGAVLSLLLLSKATEQALAIEGPCLPWLRGELERLDAARRKALVLLGDPASGPDDFRTAKKIVDSTRLDYAKVRDAGARLKVCFTEIEVGRAVLSDLAAVYPHKLAPSPTVVATGWAGLVEQYLKILSLSQPTGTGLPKLDDLAQASRSFDVRRAELMALRIGGDESDPKRLELALRWPWLRAGERDALRQRHEDASQASAKRVFDRWPSAPQEDVAPKATVLTTPDDTIRDLRIGADLLAMANAAGSAKWPVQAAALTWTNKSEMQTFDRAMRRAGRKTLLAEYMVGGLPRRVEIGWAIHPDDVPAVPLDADMANPEPAFRKQREIEFARWLGKRYALEAGELRSIKDKACRDTAEELDGVASAYRNWNP